MVNVDLLNKIKDILRIFPFSSARISELGGKERPSILISISLQKQSEWNGGYFENSPGARFHLDNNGILEKFYGYKTEKFRKTKIKDIKDFELKLKKWYEMNINNNTK